ncbi:hypothetical protein [Streptomyces sp. NBC_00996]|uniref:hypothetical protein n=1 Tax=Streptomyces sp. NBC_00996 TaxID=2903710 RepID=UPI00386AAA1A|nr:hypothetical protein OG390_10180 [Streptomyces sp. NBC_00996]
MPGTPGYAFSDATSGTPGCAFSDAMSGAPGCAFSDAMSGTPGYAYDDTSERAGGRFEALESCCHPVAFARLADLGVGPGTRCPELGGGGGSPGTRLHQVDIRLLGRRLVEEGLTEEQPDQCPRLLDDPAFAFNSSSLTTTWGVQP